MFNQLLQTMRRLLHNTKGQSATEYMLIIAIVVLGLVAAASHLIPKFEDGINALSKNVVETLQTKHGMSTEGK